MLEFLINKAYSYSSLWALYNWQIFVTIFVLANTRPIIELKNLYRRGKSRKKKRKKKRGGL